VVAEWKRQINHLERHGPDKVSKPGQDLLARDMALPARYNKWAEKTAGGSIGGEFRCEMTPLSHGRESSANSQKIKTISDLKFSVRWLLLP